MKGNTKIRLKMEVDIEVDFEIDPRFRQANIMAAKIRGEDNLITPRMVHAAMVTADYNSLDTLALSSLEVYFGRLIDEYKSAPRESFPDEGIRSLPMSVGRWASFMQTIRNCGIPISLVAKSFESVHVRLEPVLCRTPMLYVWPNEKPKLSIGSIGGNVTIGFEFNEEKMKQVKSATKAATIDKMEDGSYKVAWRK